MLEAFKAGETVRVPTGTRVREVPERQLKEECDVYSDAGVDDHAAVARKLKALRRRYSRGGDSPRGGPSRGKRAST